MTQQNTGNGDTILFCWIVAAGAGLLTFGLTYALGDMALFSSLFLAGLAAVGIGAALTWIFYEPLAPAGTVSAPPAKAPARAAPAVNTAKPVADAEAGDPNPQPAAPAPKAAPAPAPAAAPAEDDKPELLSTPDRGAPDDLKVISGIGPKLEKELNAAGVYYYAQIASWTEAEVAWADQNLIKFKGRISRDNWVEQARRLASGG